MNMKKRVFSFLLAVIMAFIYESKIEISLNYSLNTNISKTETTSKKLFTETFTSTRKFKGGTTKTTNKVYEVYLVI